MIEGMRIGVNGREANVGQAYANLNITINSNNFDAAGVPLSNLGTVIPSEKGAEQDQFFLTFDRIGSSSYARVAPTVPPAAEPQDLPAQPEIGIRKFAEINATLSAMTGIPVTESGVAATYEAVQQQMPAAEDVTGFLVAHQMGITQLSVKYCNTLASDDARMAAYFPNFSGSFDALGRLAIIDPLMTAMLAHAIPNEGQLSNQPLVADTEAHLNDLIDTMTASCGSNCSTTVTRNTITAVCAAAMGSAVMLIQ